METEVQEAEDAPCGVGHEQRHSRAPNQLHAGPLLDPLEVLVWSGGLGQVGLLEVPHRLEDRVGVKRDLAEGVGNHHLANGPFRLEDAEPACVVVASKERDVCGEELGQHAARPAQDILTRARGGRHETLCDLRDQLVQTLLVQQCALARGERRDVAQQSAKRLCERPLPARPRTTLTCDDQGTLDVAALDLDRLDQHAPRDAADDTREGADRSLSGELPQYAVSDPQVHCFGAG